MLGTVRPRHLSDSSPFDQRLMKIRILLPSVISALVLMVVGLALLAAYEARQKAQEAAKFVQVNQISSLFLRSAADWAAERGAANGALAATDPVSSDVRQIITNRRATADQAFEDAMARLQNVPEMSNQQQIVSGTQKISTMSKPYVIKWMPNSLN